MTGWVTERMLENEAKIRQIVDVCERYYLRGMNQQEIARALGISRPTVSRLINRGKEEGIVTITIHSPNSEELYLESRLEEVFGLRRAIVTNVPDEDAVGLAKAQAAAVTYFLETELRDGYTFGVMGGTTINQISGLVGSISRKNITVVPLIGGWGPATAKWQANLNVRNFGERWQCTYRQLNAPAFVSTPLSREVLINEPEISEILDSVRKSNAALVGIGQVGREASVFRSGLLRDEDITELETKGAVASICNFFLDENGRNIAFQGASRTIGVSADQLRQIPRVIAVANGKEKIPAILSTLRGKWADTFLTGIDTARAILQTVS